MSQTERFQSQWEMSCAIRRDKFNYVLPKAMRRNSIDMWIVIDHGRGTEPLKLDLGIETSYGEGIYVFYDAGGDRIERYNLGGPGSCDLHSLSGTYDKLRDKNGDLRSIVYARDPKRIALNFITNNMEGEGVHVADGLSHSDFDFLTKELGEKYAKRFVSAERLLADYHGEHVASEIVEFAKVCDITRKALERAMSNEVITPGKTTYHDVAVWLDELRESMGLRRTWWPSFAFVDPEFKGYQSLASDGTGRIIQRGDIFFIDWGLLRNNFGSDMKRTAYVLREGEVGPPPDLIKAWTATLDIREIIRKHVRVGINAKVQYQELKQHIRDAGYVYTEVEQPSEVSGIEVNVELHGMGTVPHDVVASLTVFSPQLTEYEVMPNAFLAFEYRVYSPAECWNGKKMVVAYEENVVVTERGIEWVHPPQDRILLIR